MADPKGPETGQDAKGAASARPRSPTLDLSATDVTPKAAKPEPKPADAKPSEGKPSEKTPEPLKSTSPSAAAPSTGDPAKTGAPKPETAKPDQTKPEAGKQEAAKPQPAKPEAAKPESPKPETVRPAPSASPSPAASSPADARARATAASTVQPVREGVGVLGMSVAALGGAALALIGVALFGKELIGVAQPDSSRVQAVEAKLNAVGGDVAALRSDVARIKPADTSQIETKLGALSQAAEATAGRVAGVEGGVKALAEQVAKAPPQDPAIAVLAGRIDGLELRFQNTPSPQELAILGGRMAGFEARLKELPGKDQLADLTVRIEDLGQMVDGIGQKVAAATAPIAARVDQVAAALKERPKGDPDARVVVALGALDQALTEGRPFAPELNAVKAASGETAELAPLDSHAAKGLETREALGAELAAEIAGLAPVKSEQTGSILDRFVASAGSVVKITPKDAAAGSDPAAVRARVAALGSTGDLEGALAARGSLDEQARAATEDWAGRASARVSAEKAIGSARAAALARLTSND